MVMALNPNGTMGDPNAVVTRPSVPNFNIQAIFKDFGYYPTQEEIDSLSPIFTGKQGKGDFLSAGRSAIGQYVMAKKAEAERQKVDPLAALQKKMEDSVALMKNQVTGLYTQLQDTLTSAPKLFGDMTPEQINTYLAPLQTEFKTQLATVQGVIAQRGVAGSSTENNALAQTNQQFMEKTLATGLDVGMQSQKAKAAAIQNQINSLLGLTGTEEGITAGAAGQKSAQDLGQSNLITSLPFFLDQADLQRRQMMEKSGGSPLDIAMGTISGIGQGFAEGMMTGNPYAAAAIAAAQGAAGGYQASKGTSGGSSPSSAANSLFLASLAAKSKGGGGSPSNSGFDLFQGPNSPV